MTTWVTSDLHFYHENILKFDSMSRFRRDLYGTGPEAVIAMNEDIIKKWNSRVQPEDTVILVGDACMGYSKKLKERLRELLPRLKGKIILVRGNHDPHQGDQVWVEHGHRVVDMYRQVMDDKQLVTFCHYPFASWEKGHYGAIMMHGHCVDEGTEILTKRGWKHRGSLCNDDLVASYRQETREILFKPIDEIIDIVYSGYVYEISTKSCNQRVTKGHTVVGRTMGGEYFEKPVENLHAVFKMISSGVSPASEGLGWGRGMTSLYVAISADGSIKTETNLVRIRVKKERKIEYYENLLRSLDVPFKAYYSRGMKSINFYLPSELGGYDIKGMDMKIVGMNSEEFEGFYEALGQSDGTDYGTYVSYTSAKKSEVDVIQAVCATHGKRATASFRTHGFSRGVTYCINITSTEISGINKKKAVGVTQVENEKFWCIKTEFGNFMMRRKGKVSLTGNCHGKYTGPGRIIDVGWDVYGKVMKLEDLVDIANKRPVLSVDGH